MKVVIDENLSPALARSLNALFVGEHEVVHIQGEVRPERHRLDRPTLRRRSLDRYFRGRQDRETEGGTGRFSPLAFDRLLHVLRAQWAKVTTQMQRLLALWDDIEKIAKLVAGGAMYQLPISGKIRQLKT